MAKGKVLIVEDEAVQAMLLKRILIKSGYEVVGIADNAQDAVRLAGEHRPDIVLMDIQLKGDINGIEACRAINSRCDAAVIYVTGNSDKGTYEHALSSTRSHGYLIKPVSREDILLTMEMAFRNMEAMG